MQQSHHHGIFPGSTRSRVCRFVPVLSPVRKNIFAVPSSRFITVCPGRHTSTPGLINQDHPGQHTVPYGSLRCLMVHCGSSRSTHGSLRLITVDAAVPPSRYFPRFIPVQILPVRPGIVPGSQKYICSPIITVHYGLPRSTHVNTSPSQKYPAESSFKPYCTSLRSNNCDTYLGFSPFKHLKTSTATYRIRDNVRVDLSDFANNTS